MYSDINLTTALPTITTAAAAGTAYPAATTWDISTLRDVSAGADLKMVFTWSTPFTTSTPTDINNSRIEINLYQSDNADMSSADFVGRVVSIYGALLGAPSSLLEGRPQRIVAPLPKPFRYVSYLGGTLNGYAQGLTGAKYKRYLRATFLAANSGSVAFDTSATGSLSIVLDAHDGNQFYADAISTLPNPV